MLTTILILLVALPLAVHLATTLLALLRLRPRDADPGARPFVSLVRPVCGIDRFDRETLGSSFAQDYPDYEVIFCAASEEDPAVELARALAAAHPDVKSQVLVGETLFSANPKLDNLAKGYAAATGGIWWALSIASLMWATVRLEPARVGILLMVEVLVGAVTAALIAGEHLAPLEIAGGALVLLSGLLEVWPVRSA